MRSRKFLPAFGITLLTVSGSLLAVSALHAQVALKPNGKNAAPLHLTALAAKVTIHSAQFATTDLDMTFQNEQSERVEADFLYTVPDGAVVTDFAYYYGTERVPARVAEKERAAAIYEHITTRMHDPALVEMVGKNTFRARIFPVLPNADLRVQIQYVQALPAAPHDGAVTYRLPLAAPGQERLDKISVDVSVDGLAPGDTVRNSLGAPVSVAQGVTQLLILDKNFPTKQDLAVTVTPAPAQAGRVRAHLFAAPSGGRDGFFALALSANSKTLATDAKIGLAGIDAYDTETTRIGAGLLLCGRYRAARVAHLSLNGQSVPADASGGSFTFGSVPEPNNLASKLWAAARIARLSARPDNRTAVVALSQRFTLPSKWTSWIAIPTEERARYAEEMKVSQLEARVREYRSLLEAGQSTSPRAVALRAQIVSAAKSFHRNPNSEQEWQSRQEIDGLIDTLAQRIVDSFAAGKTFDDPAVRSTRDVLFLLEQSLGSDPHATLSDAASETGSLLAKKYVVGKYGGEINPSYVGVYREFTQSRLTTYGRGGLDGQMWPAPRLSPAELRHLRTQLTNIGILSGFKADAEIAHDESPVLQWQADKLALDYSAIDHGRYILWDYSYSLESRPIVRFEPVRNPHDAVAMAKLRRQIDTLASQGHFSAENTIGWANELWGLYQNQVTYGQLQQALDIQPMNPDLVQKKADDFVAAARTPDHTLLAVDGSQIPKYFGSNTPDGRAAFARAQADRMIARREADSLDQQLAMTPNAADAASLVTRRNALRAEEERLRVRMGDPLITVDAPADARNVVALLPDGTILPLAYDAASRRWAARFDVPTTTPEGNYAVTTIAVLQDGTRQTGTFTYVVDVTPPRGTAHVTRTENGGLRLDVQADSDTARVEAFVGDAPPITLDRVAGDTPGRFFALAPPSLPASANRGSVVFVLTDRAHNRTTLTAAVEKDAEK